MRPIMLMVLSLVLLLGCASAAPAGVTALDCGLGPALSPPLVLIHDPGDPARLLWVFEDQIPSSGSTLLWGKRSLLASAEELRAAGPPPCGAPLSMAHLPGGEPRESEGMRALGIFGALLQILGRAF